MLHKSELRSYVLANRDDDEAFYKLYQVTINDHNKTREGKKGNPSQGMGCTLLTQLLIVNCSLLIDIMSG
jgi:hypothetical protein